MANYEIGRCQRLELSLIPSKGRQASLSSRACEGSHAMVQGCVGSLVARKLASLPRRPRPIVMERGSLGTALVLIGVGASKVYGGSQDDRIEVQSSTTLNTGSQEGIRVRTGGPSQQEDGSMRLGIMGAGAIGSNVGGMLARAGRRRHADRPVAAHVEAIKANGLRSSGTCGDLVGAVHALHLYEAQGIQEPFDAVFVAVKGYDTEWATMFIMRFLKEPDGVVVDFQNGINDERVAAVAGRERTLGCVITIGAGMYEPGERLADRPVGRRSGSRSASLTARTPRALGSWSR